MKYYHFKAFSQLYVEKEKKKSPGRAHGSMHTNWICVYSV